MNQYICTNRSLSYQEHVQSILEEKEKQIKDFFQVPEEKSFSFQIYIYDTIEDLVNGLHQRGFSNFPSYMCACQKDEDNSLNFFEPKDYPNEQEWSKKEYDKVIFNEEINAIQYAIYGTQPEWLTEGIAVYLDGTYQKGIKYLLENYIDLEHLPSMYELEYEFGMHEYDSYDYAYLMVCYLIEKMGKDKFLIAIKSKENIDLLSEDLVLKSVNYFCNKYHCNIESDHLIESTYNSNNSLV